MLLVALIGCDPKDTGTGDTDTDSDTDTDTDTDSDIDTDTDSDTGTDSDTDTGTDTDTGEPDCALTGDTSLVWSDATIGEASVQALTLSTACPWDLAVTTASVSDGAFEVLSLPVTVPAGGSADIEIAFTAPDYGTVVADLTLAGDADPYPVDLTGEAAADQDGDGHDAADVGGDDCDDADGSVSPSADETADGRDEDCDGVADIESIADRSAGILDGASGAVGYYGSLGVGDIDDDGSNDLIVGYPTGWSGRAWTFSARDWWDPAGWTTGDADAQISASSWSWASFGVVNGQAGDHDGDGVVDLAIAGGDAYWDGTYKNPAVSIWFSPPSSSVTSTAGELMLGGMSSAGPSRVMMRSDLDANGDGVAEVFWVNPTAGHTSSGSSWRYPGTAAWMDVSGLSGRTTFSGELHVTGADDAFLGYAVGGGDADADGYDDAVVGAPEDGSGGSSAGAVYVFLGGTSFGGTGRAEDNAWVTVVGAASDQVGLGQHTLVEDLDGDGKVDLLVPTVVDELWLFSDIASRSGTLSESDAETVIYLASTTGLFGRTLAAGDFDGNSVLDLAIGAPETEDGTAKSGAGAIYLLPGSAIVAGLVEASDGLRIDGENRGDDLGGGLLAADLSGDGIDDLVVAAPAYSLDGRLYFLDSPL